ncbi:T9SS type A sorting domain-containing protein, partial [candidate division KSB1 bacterium]|nr:T9SS type A sorting domain-containing protein [candidate division KSB1 bacterium]
VEVPSDDNNSQEEGFMLQLKFKYLAILILSGIFLTAFIPQKLNASMSTRPYDPVIVRGEPFLLFNGAPVNEIFVFVFKGGVWTQIPFQIDEKDAGFDFFGAKNGLLNINDEICFMAFDLGESVPDWQWINDAESKIYQRYEVQVVDNSTFPSTEGYAYVYRSSTLVRGAGSYISYVPGDPGFPNDLINAKSYIFGHNKKAIPDTLCVKAAVGGSDQDILDRWKIRYAGKAAGIIPYSNNEDNGLKFDSLKVKSGPIRIIRKTVFQPVFAEAILPVTVDFTAFFYPYSAVIQTGKRVLSASVGMTYLRQSIDFHSRISGSSYFNGNNSSAIINGTPDVVDTSMTNSGSSWFNWYMMSGSHGSVICIADVPNIGTSHKLYYKDDNTLDPTDTGDATENQWGVKYGDCGVQIFGTLAAPIVCDSTDEELKTTFYYLGANKPSATGDTLALRFANPLVNNKKVNNVHVVPKQFVVPVELENFSAVCVNQGVKLTWATATESQNFGFELQRKSDGNIWEKIAFVKGRGTCSSRTDYEYVDSQPAPASYIYRLKQIDLNGQFKYLQSTQITYAVVETFTLEQNFPNPFNPTTEICYQVPATYYGDIKLTIYNLLGQEIRTLVSRAAQSGVQRIVWDGLNNAGEAVQSGVYIYCLEAGRTQFTRKMIKIE